MKFVGFLRKYNDHRVWIYAWNFIFLSWCLNYYRLLHELNFLLLLDCDACLTLDLWLSRIIMKIHQIIIAEVIIIRNWLLEVWKLCWSSCVDLHGWRWLGHWWVGRNCNWCVWFDIIFKVVHLKKEVLVLHLEMVLKIIKNDWWLPHAIYKHFKTQLMNSSKISCASDNLSDGHLQKKSFKMVCRTWLQVCFKNSDARHLFISSVFQTINIYVWPLIT